MKEEKKATTMLSKCIEMSYGECGKIGQTKEKCWRIMGYPSRHPRSGRDGKEKAKEPWNTNRSEVHGAEVEDIIEVEEVMLM